MLAVIGFCDKDRDAALNLIRWIGELGGCKGHRLMLSFTQRVRGSYVELEEAAKPFFDEVLLHRCYDEDERGWPMSCNHLWLRTAYTIAQTHKEPWLWMEPDAVPLKAGWMDAIAEAYTECGRPFMGCDVNTSYCKQHMSGIAVYPPNVGKFTKQLYMLNTEAWDTFFAEDFMKNGAFTPLIQHVFWQDDDQKIQPTFPDEESMKLIDPRAVVFHRNKDQTLMEMMMRQTRMFPVPVYTESLNSGVFPKFAGDVVPATATIYTYFEPVPGIERTEQDALITLWKSAWSKAGWSPIVLSEQDAKNHPLYVRAKSVFSAFPSVNPSGYDYACFMRWLAMSAIGGGWMCDYDVMPNKPERLVAVGGIQFFSGNDKDPLIPCLVHGHCVDYNKIIDFFLQTKPTETHWSDMVALRAFKTVCYRDVKEYGEYGWEYAAAIHFSHHSMAGKTPRSRFIPELMPKAEPVETVALLPKDEITQLVNRLEKVVDRRKGFQMHARAELKRAGLSK